MFNSILQAWGTQLALKVCMLECLLVLPPWVVLVAGVGRAGPPLGLGLSEAEAGERMALFLRYTHGERDERNAIC